MKRRQLLQRTGAGLALGLGVGGSGCLVLDSEPNPDDITIRQSYSVESNPSNGDYIIEITGIAHHGSPVGSPSIDIGVTIFSNNTRISTTVARVAHLGPRRRWSTTVILPNEDVETSASLAVETELLQIWKHSQEPPEKPEF